MLVRAGSVCRHRSGLLINIDPAWARVKLGPIIEPETEARAKAYEHVMDTLREIAFMWHQDES